METTQQRFARLLSLVLDGACTEEDREELAQLVVENPGVEPELVEALSIHSLLQWQSEDVSRVLADLGLHQDVAALARDADSRTHASSPQVIPLPFRWTWAAAALLLIAFGALAWRVAAPATSRPIAEVVAAEGIQWSDKSTAFQIGNSVGSGRLQSDAGSFTLKFRSGPIVRFRGPTTVDIESDMLLALERGQATADVPESGIGFTIKTANVRVIDQGTQFGVAIGEEGDTDVIVFQGKVDLKNQIRLASPQQQLNRGEAVRVDATGEVKRLMQVGQNAEGDWWSTGRADLDHTIKEVRDNIPVGNGTRYSCFQIAFGGLKDDEFAYADHQHQWNGLSAEGLPEFLRGADLVRTFNDYRYIRDLEMVVTLHRPANLYVFFDDRVPTPEWLSSQFEDTGVDIGLDEGKHELTPEHELAVGGGNSIDQIFSVWKRECKDLTPIRLGPVGPTSEARAMYGIAATPLVRRLINGQVQEGRHEIAVATGDETHLSR